MRVGILRQLEFRERTADVAFHGPLGDHQPGRYCLVGQAFCDQPKDFPFPVGELRDAVSHQNQKVGWSMFSWLLA